MKHPIDWTCSITWLAGIALSALAWWFLIFRVLSPRP